LNVGDELAACRADASHTSRRSSEAPTPQLSFGIDRPALQGGSRRIRDGGDELYSRCSGR